MSNIAPFPLHLFAENDSEPPLNDLRGEDFLRKGAKMVLKLLWQPWSENDLPNSIFDDAFFKQLNHSGHTLPIFYRALLKDSDPFFLKAARLEVQECLFRLTDTLMQTPPANDAQHEKVNLCLHNMLSIYVMFNPTPYETLFIPHCINGIWAKYEFTINPIELSPTKGILSHFINEDDRLFSYGLTSKDNSSLPRLLVHRGTGWSTAQGIMLQILADIWPDKTPGEIYFEWQKDAINTWLDESPNKVITCGQSLGGSLAYLTAMHRPDKISKAICLVPPGMTKDYHDDHPLFGAWEKTETNQKPDVTIQRPKGDPVSKCGVFKKEFVLKQTNVLNEPLLASPLRHLFAHARNAPACDMATIVPSDIEVENESPARKANNEWLYNTLRYPLFYGVILPYFFIVKPIVYMIKKNAFRLSIALLFLTLCAIFPSLAMIISQLPILSGTTTAIACIISSVIISYWVTACINITYDVFFNSSAQTKNYLNDLKVKTVLSALFCVFFDLINTIGANVLKTSIHLIDWMIYTLPTFFQDKKYTEAFVHSSQYHEMTRDLNDHPQPTFDEKLQVFGFIILFYAIAFPIKAIVYDLPKCLKKCFASYSSHETSDKTSVSHQSDELSPDINEPNKGHQKTTLRYLNFFNEIPAKKNTQSIPSDNIPYDIASKQKNNVT